MEASTPETRAKMRVSRWDQESTLESAEAQLSRLLENECLIQAKLNKLNREIDELETERNTIDAECGHLSLFVAKKLCRKFADKFHAMLPPELRDMVYVHVWDDETVNHVFGNVCDEPKSAATLRPIPMGNWRQTVLYCSDDVKGMPWSVGCEHPCHCFKSWELPFWVQHQFVGFDVARKAAAAYYRVMRHGRLVPHLGQLETFLSSDHFHLGVKPADHIRRLELNFSSRLIEYGAKQACSTESLKGSQVLERNLRALMKVRFKQGFQLTIKIDGSTINFASRAAIKVLRPVASEIQETGGSVTLIAKFASLGKSYDVSDYFTPPPFSWEKKWAAKDVKGMSRFFFRSAHADLNNLDDDYLSDDGTSISDGFVGHIQHMFDNGFSVDHSVYSGNGTSDPTGENTIGLSRHAIGTMHPAANDTSNFDNSAPIPEHSEIDTLSVFSDHSSMHEE